MSFDYCTLSDVKRQLLGLDVSDLPSSLESRITDTYIPWAKRDVDTFLGQNLDLTINYQEWYSGTGTATLHLRRRPINRIRACVLRVIPSVQWFQFRRMFQLNVREVTGSKIAEQGGYEPIGNAVPPYIVAELGDVGVPTATFTDSEEQYGRSDLLVDCSKGTLTIPPRILFLENQAVPFWNYTWLRGQNNISVTYDYGYKDQASLPREFVDATALLAAAYVLKDKALWTGSGAQSIGLEGVSRSFGESPFAGIIKNMEEKAYNLLKRRKRLNVA
jgi:hypothetical protein